MNNEIKVLDHGFVRLVEKTGNVGASVVNAARCSYGSTGDYMGERDRKLIRFLLGNGHTSPFRHAYFTFHFKMPLFVMRQITKYQVGSTWREYETLDGEPVAAIDVQYSTDSGCSWNELSGRYRVMEPEFYVPARLRKAKTDGNKQGSDDWDGDDYMVKSIMVESFFASLDAYNDLLDEGVAKELARLVLPPSIYSECYWTVSLQAVLHFLDQRLKPDAQFEIREYARAILELVRPTLSEMGIDAEGAR